MIKFIWRYPTRFWFVVLELFMILAAVTFVNAPASQLTIFCLFVAIPVWVIAKIIKFFMISWANYTCPYKPKEIMNWLMYIEDRLPVQHKSLGWESMLDIALETNAKFPGSKNPYLLLAVIVAQQKRAGDRWLPEEAKEYIRKHPKAFYSVGQWRNLPLF
ncbi:hypothetical protein ID964_004510 [Salmonella enterica]|nr:hypothetical protein [Salmonella enterica]